MKTRGNLFEDVADAVGGERFEDLLRRGGTRIERIVSQGQTSPPDFWYAQEKAEWVLVVRGQARLRLEDPDEEIALGPGDWLTLPPLRKHRVEWTTPDEPTVWLAVWAGESPLQRGEGNERNRESGP